MGPYFIDYVKFYVTNHCERIIRLKSEDTSSLYERKSCAKSEMYISV